MKHVRLAKKLREQNPNAWDKLYEGQIIERIRTRYTVNQELAILRQRDSKPEEFEAYNAYVEACKAEVKKEMEVYAEA